MPLKIREATHNHDRRMYEAARAHEEAAVARRERAEKVLIEHTIHLLDLKIPYYVCTVSALTCDDKRNEVGRCLYNSHSDFMHDKCIVCGLPEDR